MITCAAVTGIGEVTAGESLADLLLAATDLRDGDVLVVTSKVVSKAEGRLWAGDKAAALAQETDRIVARRGSTTIVRTRHGLVMAAAGIDASNTAAGTLVLLPVDPDASARALREAIAETGPNVAVLVSDTSGRAWRNGQTDIAVGAAGLEVIDDHAGRHDGYGNLLAVTAPAVADEITAAADLVTGKLSRSPAAVVRGLERLVLPRGEHGSGAVTLVRAEEADMFGLGTREAVVHALVRDQPRGFGAPAALEDLVTALSTVAPELAPVRSVAAGREAVEVALATTADLGERRLGVLEERCRAVAFAHGWRISSDGGAARKGVLLRFTPVTP